MLHLAQTIIVCTTDLLIKEQQGRMYKTINRHKLYKPITKGKTEVAALPEIADSATALARSNAGFDEVIDIINNGTQSVSEPGDGVADALAIS